VIVLGQSEFEQKMTLVISALSSAGYDPNAQLTGYLQTGDESYITRQNNARAIIRDIDKNKVAQYITSHLHNEVHRKE
jgi:uncharacterized protein (UPF0297 family)